MQRRLARLCSFAAVAVSLVSAAGWGFEDGSVRINTKGAGIDAGAKQTLSTTTALSSELSLGPSDTLKLILTVVDDTTGKRAHQTFLTLQDPASGLSDSFPITVKETGKATISLTQKDLPSQFLTSNDALKARLTIASFGASAPFDSEVFSVRIAHDASAAPPAAAPAPLRYGKLAEIKHSFRGDPKSPPVFISSVFTLAVLAALPVLLGAWLLVGANFSHLGKAFGKDPVSHIAFYGSVAAIEGVFFLYYTSWNLFQTLPAVGVLGVVAVVSGSRALTEVQERRLAGER